MKLAKILFITSVAALTLSAVAYACTSNPTVSANINGYTLTGGTTAVNPAFGNPYGYATTQSSSPMNTLTAECVIYNTDGTSTDSGKYYGTNTTSVQSSTVTADSYFASGVYIISNHNVLDSRIGGLGWSASSTYCF